MKSDRRTKTATGTTRTLVALAIASLGACDDGKQTAASASDPLASDGGAVANQTDATGAGSMLGTDTGAVRTSGAVIADAAAAGAAGALGTDPSGKVADASAATEVPASYVLSSVVIDADGNRTTYVQSIPSLDGGPFTNQHGVEIPGNGVTLASASAFYAGLAEEPTWVRYELDARGALKESARMSLQSVGAQHIDYGNVLVDAQTAVSVLSNPPLAVIWDPTTMTIRGQIELGFLARAGYELEVWTTATYGGLVYIPGRWSDWTGSRIHPSVSTTILDPKAMSVLGTATDERCASGGKVVFDAQGYAYVMGDGRTDSIQVFANVSGGSAPDNCLLRIAPKTTVFEQAYYYTIRPLTGGLESISELDTASQGSGIAFSKMFYPDKLPPDVKPVDFSYWDYPAHKLWRIELGAPPRAEEVQGIPFSTIGFSGAVLDGRMYTGESRDGGKTSDVYETDPATNRAVLRFKMDGYFSGLNRLTRSAP